MEDFNNINEIQAAEQKKLHEVNGRIKWGKNYTKKSMKLIYR